MQYLILCRSLTQAQQAALLLEHAGIYAAVTKAPRHLTQNGCGYALRVTRKAEQAVALLRKKKVSIGKIYQKIADGSYQEAAI